MVWVFVTGAGLLRVVCFVSFAWYLGWVWWLDIMLVGLVVGGYCVGVVGP